MKGRGLIGRERPLLFTIELHATVSSNDDATAGQSGARPPASVPSIVSLV